MFLFAEAFATVDPYFEGLLETCGGHMQPTVILKAALSLLHYSLFIFLASRPVTSLLLQSYVRLL